MSNNIPAAGFLILKKPFLSSSFHKAGNAVSETGEVISDQSLGTATGLLRHLRFDFSLE